MKKKLTILITVSMLAGLLAGSVSAGTKFGAPTEGMSTADYQALVFLDPQNTIRTDWDVVRKMSGYFLIDNQGEPTVSVVDYQKGETIKKIQMGETGNHHIFVIPGARYAWSSQRYEKDVFWTIDLITLEVIDKFNLSMDGKKVIAPLHVGFAYTQPLAVVGNILDKKNGYLTFLSTATRRPLDIVELGCPGARDAMFTLDDSKVFATCQQAPKGVSIVDVNSRKEIKVIPIKGARAGGMTPDGKYFLVGAKGAIILIDTATNEIAKTIKVPGGGGNFTCLPDGSKCYGGLRKDNSVAVIDMATLELIKVIKTGPNANRLYLNSANPRYGLFTNESGKSEVVSVIDTEKDVKIKDIITGLGPHNVAFDPTGKFALVTTKKENVATLIDTSSANPADWDVITTDIESGIQNNGVRWVPAPSAIKAAL
ncbi:MAG: YncE family protein [SAR324 cluster bacterium]|jgi:YVTN family beta-propeller protein|nr:YncE family protein [SAR324 cluster bacterium]